MSFPQSIGDFFRPGVMPNPTRATVSVVATAILVSTVALAVFGSISLITLTVIAVFSAIVITGAIIGSVGMTALGAIGIFGTSFAASAAAGTGFYYTPVYIP